LVAARRCWTTPVKNAIRWTDTKAHLAWRQFGCARDLGDQQPPWDWFFHAER
jgi:hypothetical protein